ncbi:alpha-tocopherol transfer protein-like isoform X1 [Homalodisca vitripennis]|uniref:alpha-tocopherol transfer protein-like isoform X1 n=1 Tax=Homalodisca vitripennis TaxID=197043 RepID=UPI001EEB2456|nr:alpha-tocopherol transfer protein-like isoform X1 [Homalodisca vitripennis]
MLPLIFRGCKHNLERAKVKVDTYYSVRGSMPEIFQSRDPLGQEILEASKHMIITPLPNLTPEGYRVTVHTFTNAPVADFEPASLYKLIFMKADIRMVEESLIAGDVFVFDVGQLSLTHIAKLATPLIKSALHCAQEAYPQRLKEIHMINAPTYVDKVVNVYKMFMKEKIRNRFHIHTSYKTLYPFIPQSILPSNFGGGGKSVETLEGEWKKKLESYADWFTKQESIVTNEKRRLSKSTSTQNTDNIFGCEGAFRKLAID